MSFLKSESTRTIAYWFTTLMGPASFVVGGTLFLSQGDQQVAVLAHLGYPAYLLYILGFWKWVGAVVTVVPGLPLLKEWAYAGFFFDLTGAAASHAFAGDGLGPIVQPLVFLVLVMASWALRPASRRVSRAPGVAS